MFNDDTAFEEQQFTCLHRAVLGLSTMSIATMLQNMTCSEIDYSDVSGRTPLWWAVRRSDTAVARLLLEYGADPNKNPRVGFPILHSAVASNEHTTVELLLRAGAHINELNTSGTTALSVAASQSDNVDILRILLKYGINMDVQNRRGKTGLMWASVYGRSKMVAFLIQHKVDVQLVDSDGAGALHYAITGNHPNIVRLLLQAGVDYHLKSKNAGTIIHLAAQVGDIDVLKELARAGLAGMDVDDKYEGLTALEYARQRRSVPTEWLETFRDLLTSLRRCDAAAAAAAASTEDDQSDDDFYDSMESHHH